MSIAIRDGVVHFVTATNSGKAKRLRRNSRVSLTISGGSRRAAFGPIEGRVIPVPGAGWGTVLRLVRPTPSLVGSYLLYRLRRVDLTLFQVVLDSPTPHGLPLGHADGENPSSPAGVPSLDTQRSYVPDEEVAG